MQANVIGRRCTVCDSPARPLIDGAMLSGDAVLSIAATVGKAAGLSEAALYRHRRGGHHAPKRFATALPGESTADVVRGIVSSVEAASMIRDAARSKGADVTILRASAEVRAGSVALAERLGINETSVADGLRYGEELAVIVRHAAMETPSIALALADHARRLSRDELADDADALYALATAQKEN